MAKALTGRQMLRRAHESMKHDSRKKARRHHASVPMPMMAHQMNPRLMGGANSAGYNRNAQAGANFINSGMKSGSVGYNADQQGGEFNTKSARKAHKHASRRRSHKSHRHHSVMGLSESRKRAHRSHKHEARKRAKPYRGGTPTQGLYGKGLKLSRKRSHRAHKHESHRHESHKHAGKTSAFGSPSWRAKFMHKGARKHEAKKLPHLKPKGKIGKAQTGRLNRNFKTGGFNKIASSAGREYGSKAAGQRVAGAIFHKMAEARGNAARKSRGSRKSYAHKGHTHRSRKAMKEC